MESTFFGINISTSGLFAARRGLHVVSHNIANTKTEGYSRQRVDSYQRPPFKLPSGKGSIGTGTESNFVIQIRSDFLDIRTRTENTVLGEWEVKEGLLDNIDTIFNEPSDSSLNTSMNEFFRSLKELNTNPQDLSVRALVRQKGIAFIKNCALVHNSLVKLQNDIDFNIRQKIGIINEYAEEIAKLNNNIYSNELDGSMANDLRDQRNLILDKLSKIVNINYYEDEQNKFHVQITGQPLVSHIFTDKLVIKDRIDIKNPYDLPRLADIEFESKSTFKALGGEIKGYIDMRDNIDANNKGIPFYIDQISEFTDRLISELNRINMTGFGLRGTDKIMLFTENNMSTADYEAYLMQRGFNGKAPLDVTDYVLKGTDSKLQDQENYDIISGNIKDILYNNPQYKSKSIRLLSDGRYYIVDRIPTNSITISKDVDRDLSKIAASSVAAGELPGNGENALRFRNIRNNRFMYATGSPDDFMQSMISSIGVDANQAKYITSAEKNILTDLDIKRQSLMGVSEDEEVADMIRYQHAFSANARMVTTFDEMLDVIINRLGTVGR